VQRKQKRACSTFSVPPSQKTPASVLYRTLYINIKIPPYSGIDESTTTVPYHSLCPQLYIYSTQYQYTGRCGTVDTEILAFRTEPKFRFGAFGAPKTPHRHRMFFFRFGVFGVSVFF